MAENTSPTFAPVPTIPAGYTVRAGLPSAHVYRDLRSAAGIIPVTADQAEAAVKGTWYGCHIVHTSTSSEETVVGMGAVIANGSWYFHIVDVAILPEHQRRGLGKVVIHAIMEYILANKPEGRPFISLSASAQGASLYRKSYTRTLILMPTMASARGGRMRTRSQSQVPDKRSADELETVQVNTNKRFRTYHGRRQVLQPISIKEETKEDIRVKSQSASPVPLASRNNQTMTRRRDPHGWDDDMHLQPSPSYPITRNQSSSPGGRMVSRLTAKLRSRRALTDMGIAAPKIKHEPRTGQEDEAPARGAPSRQGSTDTPSIALLREEEQKREEDLRLLREQIAEHYPFPASRTNDDVAELESESEDSSSSGEDDTGSGSNKSSSIRERSWDDDDSDDTDSDENENMPLFHLRRRITRTVFVVSSPVPKKEDGDTTESEDEEDDVSSSPVQNKAEDQYSKSSSSIASSSEACSTCGDREAFEDSDSDSNASNVATDIESQIAIYNDDNNDAHTRLNEVLRRVPASSPTGSHQTAGNQPAHDGMQLRSPAQIIQGLRQDEAAADQHENVNAAAAYGARLQSSSPPRAYDYDEYRLRARYLEQFKEMTAVQLDEAGRDLDYRARKLNSKRSAYEMALHERAFPRY
ncbi:hypothetical protein PspLS_10254 [Pyricularia sp. CBS 133598]|nr:hypothetical protein PspLS_10254 [Pyricularia sp. CBS 133598]